MPFSNNNCIAATHKLLRYEALFGLMDEIYALADIPAILKLAAYRTKYFVAIVNWRVIIKHPQGFLILEVNSGEARQTIQGELVGRDKTEWDAMKPRLLRGDSPDQDVLPDYIVAKNGSEVLVLPLMKSREMVGLLCARSRQSTFSDLDHQFIRIFFNRLTERIRDILIQTQLLKGLSQQAAYDFLTELPNRRTILEHLNNCLSNARRTEQHLSVLIADIDNFKRLNDTYGHLTGDAVLKEISGRFKKNTREGEMVGRFGGEEFLFVLYPCSQEGAAYAAERIRQAIAGKAFRLSEKSNSEIDVTVSIGVTTRHCDDSDGKDAILRRADDALYLAKNGGRNLVCTK